MPGLISEVSGLLWRRFVVLLFLAAILPGALLPQSVRDGGDASAAVITFALDFPQSDPQHYSIEVHSDAPARYECNAKISQDSDEREPYEAKFELSASTRSRIFDLAARAHYFSDKIDSGNRKLAYTGAKKLTYENGGRSFTADYIYSNLPQIQQLTALFQNLAATLDYGRRLAYYHHYQKLALDEELSRMEEQSNRNELMDLRVIEPVLQGIADDASVMNVVRARAQRLIEAGKSEAHNTR